MPINPSGELTPPTRLSPIIPKKMPAVPPPFGSPNSSPTAHSLSFNTSQTDFKTNVHHNTPVFGSTNEFECNNDIHSTFGGGGHESPPPPVPPRQKNV